MARIASFTSAGTPVDPTGGMTLDALMLRQKELAAQQAQIAAPRQMVSPWQGAAALAQQFVNARQESSVQDQMTAGRQQLAQAVAGIDPATGAVPQASIGTAMSLDPETGLKLLQTSIEARRLDRERQQHLDDIASERQFTVGQIKEKQTYEQSQPITDVGKIDAELAAGRITQQEADTAKAALAPVTYRPPTDAEIKAYNLNPSMSYRVNTKTGEPEAVGTQMQLIPPEFASKIALGDEFLSNYDNIRAEAAKGGMTGPIDYATSAVLGRGPGGESFRQLKQGSEALLRMLTGAGVSNTEAASQVQQYEPSMTDDAATLVSKIDGLKAAMVRIRSGATQGRQSMPAPESKPPPPSDQPPAGVAVKPGETRTYNGVTYTFKGGDAGDPQNWTK